MSAVSNKNTCVTVISNNRRRLQAHCQSSVARNAIGFSFRSRRSGSRRLVDRLAMRTVFTLARLLVLALVASAAVFASAAEECTCPPGGDTSKPVCTLANVQATAGNTCVATVVGGNISTNLNFVGGSQTTATDNGIAFANVTTWNGFVKVQSPGNLVANCNCEGNAFAMNDTVTINGDLSISGSNIYTRIFLPKLKHVNGSITITGLGFNGTQGFVIETIDLSSLETVSGDLKIYDNPSLKNLHLPSLKVNGTTGDLIFTGNDKNFTLSLSKCISASAVPATFSKKVNASNAGLENVTVNSAACTPAPVPEAKSVGGELVFSIIDPITFDFNTLRLALISPNTAAFVPTDVVFTNVSYVVSVSYNVTTAQTKLKLQDAIAKKLNVAPRSVWVKNVTGVAPNIKVQLEIYSSKTYQEVTDLKNKLRGPTGPDILGVSADVVSIRLDLRVVIKGTPTVAGAIYAAFMDVSWVEWLYTRALTAVSLGGTFKYITHAYAAPLMPEDEILTATTSYPGAPPAPKGAPTDGSYYAIVTNDPSPAVSGASLNIGTVAKVFVAAAVAAMVVW